MPRHEIEQLDDPRLAPYRDLKAQSMRDDTGQTFIAEGKLVVRRLLESRLPVQSVLLAESRVAAFAGLVPESVPVLVLPDQLVSRLVGFQFHSGVIACGEQWWADESVVRGWPDSRRLVICCPDLTLADNLGAIARLAAGFGAAGLVVGPRSIHPWCRRCVRVSMGQIFRLNLFRPDDLPEFLGKLRTMHGFRLVAAERTGRSVSLASHVPAARTVLLLGNEGRGLEQPWLEMADEVVQIEMAEGVDSLNVAVAAGIAMYELTRSASASRRT